MIFNRHSLAGLLILVATLIVGTVGPSSPRLASASSPSPLSSSPAQIAKELALGTSEEMSLSLSHNAASTITPQLYEALAGSATPASSGQAVPADLAQVALPDQAERIDPELSAALATAPDTTVDFLVFLGEQADLSAAYTISDWAERGTYVYQALHDQAEESQAGLRALLAARGVAYTPLWIVNALAVHGNASDMAVLAARSDVAMLRANHLTAITDSATTNQVTSCLANSANVCWHLVKIEADRAWSNFGVYGAGVTVANIDSGANYSHPALVGQYRGNTGSGFDHNYNWFDPYGHTTSPRDSGTHGTHTMGTMVASGGASASAPAVGVAPQARWIAARACGLSNCSDTALIEAAQWMLAPTDLDGANPRPDLRPQIINNSWSAAGGNNWYAGYVAAWRAAGIFPVFAAGNTGNGSTCGSVQSPGDYAQVVGVGALDSSNLIASYSSIGPSSSGLMKPDISAPGTGIASTVSSSSYASMNGTSMATPQVAGTVALLWSANPSLIGDYDRTYEILTESAVPISGDTRFDSSTYSLCHASSSPNNIYGYGQLDAYAAVAEASVDVPWLSLLTTSPGPLNPAQSTNITIKLDANQVPGPGTYEARILVHVADLSQAPLIIPVTLTVPASASYATVSGQLTRAADGAALKGTVSVTNGPSVSSDDNGMYQITLLPSAVGYTLTASSYEYIPQTVSTTLAASENRTYNFALSANEARLDADTALLSDSIALGEQKAASFDLHNASTKSVTYSASIPAQEYGVWRSSQADGPAATWIDTPTDAVTLSLGDDTISAAVAIGFAFPFFEMRPETVRIAANGFLAFSTTTTSSGYTASCLPLSETTGAAIIPLRIDLNPTAGGRVSYARTADGFLVSWENVPLFSAPAHLESFQVLLGPDGRITLNYKQLSGVNPGGKPSAGLQLNSATTQSLGCGSSLSLGNNQTIELRPQPNTALWAALGSSSGSVLASSQISLPVQISWVRSTWPWPLSADIVVQSGDSAIPPTTLTVRMSMLAAPYNTFSPVIMREP